MSSSTYDEVVRQVTQNLRRDEHQKTTILAQFPQITFSMDAAAIAEASSRELATRVLNSFGLKVPKDIDPLMALDSFMAGRRHAQQLAAGCSSSALDGMRESGGNYMDRYLAGK